MEATSFHPQNKTARVWGLQTSKLPFHVTIILSLLVGPVDRGNEHFEQHCHHGGDVVDDIEDRANVLKEPVVLFEHDGRDIRQATLGPKQCLETTVCGFVELPLRDVKAQLLPWGEAYRHIRVGHQTLETGLIW